jgi:hypothetical protein
MGLMPFSSSKTAHMRGLALVGAIVVSMIGASAVTPVFAGDDGQAPIWTGLGGLVGLTGKDKEERIDYRERPRLVLPPKMELLPPASPNAQGAAAWPVDPDVVKARKEKEASLSILSSQSDTSALRDGNYVSFDKLRADHSMPGATNASRHCTTRSATQCNTVPFRNVFESIGLLKADDVVAGQEPDRDWLTDPPKGYRTPTSNTTVKFDQGDVKKANDRDPRTSLYHAPDQ